ncbi:putative nuclease HARBI1 [Merluccius polli]|uniref:Nuclease HARBI1 n=1 Tax=Merluccius polli TaxID=89951 RepID=A0AA47NU16_MERPO|nr:putative nuclease HARBI1 [Merluccius polli]
MALVALVKFLRWPRHYAERPNLLEQYSNDELYARYRFGRDDIAFICNILRPRLELATLRSHALTVEEQVLIALRFYASGSFYEVIGDGLAVRKSAVGPCGALSVICPYRSSGSICEMA